MGSSINLLKLDFFSYPSKVELSAIDREQSPLFSLPAIMSIHGVIIAVMCSRRLFEAWNWRWSGR
eukprot:14016344-Ditylum_brightwellii.AAC.1